MTAYDMVVRGGTVVTEAGPVVADLAVRNGKVAAIGAGFTAAEAVDASGLLVLPGGVDSHAHVDQQGIGATNPDSFATGTGSAAAGGTTTVVCFAGQPRGGSLEAATRDYVGRIESGARIDVGLHLMITDPTEQVLSVEVPALIEAGHRSIKVFMTYDRVRLTDDAILRVLAVARSNAALVCIHAEHHDMCAYMTERLLAAGLTAPKYHAWAKPIVVERECNHRAIALAELMDQPIQIFHVSGAEPAEEIARARAKGLKVWGETCTQYLTLTADDLDRPGFEGAKFLCSPALRTKADQAALWAHLREGTLSNVTSDHSPTKFDAVDGKKIAGEDAPFTQIPNGLPGLAARLPVVYSEGVGKGRIDLATFVAITATNAAKIMGLYPKKGTLQPGSDADFVLFDPQRAVTLTNALMQHGSDYTPYEGMAITGWPVATYVRGAAVMRDGEIIGAPGSGKLLRRGAYDTIEPLGRPLVPFDPVSGRLL